MSAMSRASIRNLARRIGPILGAGVGGWLGTLEVTHRPGTAAIAAAVAVTALAANTVKWVCKSLPEIIEAKSRRETALISTASEARALTERTKARTALLRAGIESDRVDQVVAMLRQQSVDADLPQGRRLNDVPLAKLLVADRPRETGDKPRSGPGRPSNGTRSPRSESPRSASRNVVPLRPRGAHPDGA
jgi:hypothetical protein